MNSGVVPQLLPRNQTAFSTNCTHRGGFLTHRPPVRKMTLDFGDDTTLQARVENAIWQGAAAFRSEYGDEGLVASIGGRIFFFVIPIAGEVEVRDVTPITDGADDPNSSSNPIAWLWQSERWMIINDGLKLPIFFDGAIARRSRGASQEVGELAIGFGPLAIGASADITLTADYEGPYNEVVNLNGAYYQVNAATGGLHQVTLKNLSEPAGLTVSAGSQLFFPTNLLGQLSQAAAAVRTQGGVVSFQQTIVGGQVVSNPTPTATPEVYGIPLRFEAPAPTIVANQYLSARDGFGTQYLSGPAVFLGFSPQVYLNGVPPGSALEQYAPVYNGAIAGSSPLNFNTSASFVTPARLSEVTVTVGVPYTGELGKKVVVNGGLYEIVAVNNVPVPSNVINVTNINDTAAVLAGAKLTTVAELPAGRMGAYGLGRNWFSLPDGRSFVASDIVGGSSGSPALNFRDAVLRMTENEFLNGGGTFVIPGNLGDIKAMVFTANLDTSLGQGPLQVGTPSTIFSCQAPVDRTTWQDVTNPILTESLKGKGPLGQYGTILVNSDTIFRSVDGITSLILARRDFDTHGNVPISREMDRVIAIDEQGLLPNATVIQFDNRVLVGCFPFSGSLGVLHQGVIALNLDPVSGIRGKQPSIYDGLWTGLNVFQFVAGTFAGDERAFAFCYDTFVNRIQLFELMPSEAGASFDNGELPITWSCESSSLFQSVKGKGQFDLAELVDGELDVSDVVGPVTIQVWYRPDYAQCWTPWHTVRICADNMLSGAKQFRVRVGLGRPSATDCDPTNDRPYRIGYSFQVRIQVSGSCKLRSAIFKAAPKAESLFSVQKCETICEPGQTSACEPCAGNPDCLEFPLVFYNLNAGKSYTNLETIFNCANGGVVIIPAGSVNYTLPFPTDFDGEYPPIVIACPVGGSIVRTIPSGASQADIDTIVEEMIAECVQAQAEAQCALAGPPEPPPAPPTTACDVLWSPIFITSIAVANANIAYQAVTASNSANITIAYVDPGAPSQPLSIVVVGNAITVNLATNGGSAITSTAGDIIAAITASSEASALITAAVAPAEDGSGIVTALAAFEIGSAGGDRFDCYAVADPAGTLDEGTGLSGEWLSQ